MAYPHASRDLKDRHDIYSFIPKPTGYFISHREYGAGQDLSGYLRQAGWSPSTAPRYSLTHDSYRLKERMGSNPVMLYDRSFSRHKNGYAGERKYNSVASGYKPAGRLESRLFLN